MLGRRYSDILNNEGGRTMRKVALLTVAFLQFPFLLDGAPSEGKPAFQLRLFGGAGYHLLGDFSDCLTGWDNMVDAHPYSYIEDGEFSPFHWGWEAGCEALLPIAGRLSLGLGVGYIQTGKDSVREIASAIDKLSPYEFFREELNPSVQAIPITLNIHLVVDSNSRLTLTVMGGLGLYLGSVDWEYRRTNKTSLERYDETWTGTSSGLGCQGGLELNFPINRRLELFIEGIGRYVRMTGFRGDYFAGSTVVRDAYLWYTEWGQFPLFVIAADVPTGGIYDNVRKAVADLSGFSVRAGLIVRFGSSD
jgi:hypothetical protein